MFCFRRFFKCACYCFKSISFWDFTETYHKSPVLPTITAAEINYLAFNIASTDYHIELYGNLQHKLGDADVIDTDTYIKSHNLYNASIYRRLSSFTNRNGHVTNYETLSTYIRNSIDHPDPIKRPYTSSELQSSIDLLIEICNSIP